MHTCSTQCNGCLSKEMVWFGVLHFVHCLSKREVRNGEDQLHLQPGRFCFLLCVSTTGMGGVGMRCVTGILCACRYAVCVDVWMCGCVDVWMCGCVDVLCQRRARSSSARAVTGARL